MECNYINTIINIINTYEKTNSNTRSNRVGCVSQCAITNSVATCSNTSPAHYLSEPFAAHGKSGDATGGTACIHKLLHPPHGQHPDGHSSGIREADHIREQCRHGGVAAGGCASGCNRELTSLSSSLPKLHSI